MADILIRKRYCCFFTKMAMHSSLNYLLLLFSILTIMSNIDIPKVNADGLFFNSKAYGHKKKDDDSFKDTGDPNPWLVESPQSSNPKPEVRDAGSAYQGQNKNTDTVQNNKVHSMTDNNQRYQSQTNSDSQVKDVYLQSVNTRQQHGSSNRNPAPQFQNWPPQHQNQNPGGSGSANFQAQDPRAAQTAQDPRAAQTAQDPRAAQTVQDPRGYNGQNRNNDNRQQNAPPSNQNPRDSYRGNHPSYSRNFIPPTTTTTTTTTAPKKNGDGMFFNSWQYNQGKKKTEPDWKKNDEPNPFLFDNPNKPRQEHRNVQKTITEAPAPKKPEEDNKFFNSWPYNQGQKKAEPDWKKNDEPNPFLFQNPNQPQQQEERNQNPNQQQQQEQRNQPQDPYQRDRNNRRPPEEKPEPPQVWKTKWQFEEEEELKAKEKEKERNSPSNFDTDQQEYQPPSRLKDRPFNKHGSSYIEQSYVPKREDLERSGELEQVPKSFYEGKLDRVDENFKFMEPEPETMPLVGNRHFRSGKKESYEFEEDPPTSIQKMKNWFMKPSGSKANSPNMKIISFLAYLARFLF